MGDISEFVWGVIASTAGTTMLLGGAAFLFRTQISHWLSKDLEKTKAAYQRELEAYKVSLIAETERSKAVQALKTAGALLVVEKKFESLVRLNGASEMLSPQVMLILSSESAELRRKLSEKMHTRLEELIAAFENARIFLSGDDRRLMQSFLAEMTNATAFALKLKGNAELGVIMEYEIKLHNSQNVASELLRKLVHAMMLMEDLTE